LLHRLARHVGLDVLDALDPADASKYRKSQLKLLALRNQGSRTQLGVAAAGLLRQYLGAKHEASIAV